MHCRVSTERCESNAMIVVMAHAPLVTIQLVHRRIFYGRKDGCGKWDAHVHPRVSRNAFTVSSPPPSLPLSLPPWAYAANTCSYSSGLASDSFFANAHGLCRCVLVSSCTQNTRGHDKINDGSSSQLRTHRHRSWQRCLPHASTATLLLVQLTTQKSNCQTSLNLNFLVAY
jgi:hypothetical protein